jgi:hypothetical protein
MEQAMKKTFAIFCLFAAALAFAAEKPVQRVAVFGANDVSKSLADEEILHLTNKVHEIATKVLFGKGFVVLNEDALRKEIKDYDKLAYAACTDKGSCVGDLAKKVRAQYGARCDVSKIGENFALKFELSSVEENWSIVFTTDPDLEDFKAIVAAANEKIPDEFKKILPRKPPSAPLNFKATPGHKQVELSWTAPSRGEGDSEITGYQVSKDNGSEWMDAEGTGYTFDNLENGKSYAFKVRAVIDILRGAEASVSATPASTPSEPRDFTAKPGNGRVELSWTKPYSDGGSDIMGYKVSRDEGASIIVSGTKYTFDKLVNGTAYVFRVWAVNANGDGAEASVAETPDKPSTGIDQPPSKGNNSFWVALALDVAGAGLIAYGITQHFKADKAFDEYMDSDKDFDSSWKKVEDAKSSRNLFYIMGGVSLGLGIGVHFIF